MFFHVFGDFSIFREPTDYQILGPRLVQRLRKIEIDGSQLLRGVRKSSAPLDRSGILCTFDCWHLQIDLATPKRARANILYFFARGILPWDIEPTW